MKAVSIITGRGVPLKRSDVDTDQIIPAEWLKRVERTGFEKGSQRVYVQVRDHGPGIPEMQMAQMFEPFTQGDIARGSSGSGLGLAIIKKIVDMHHGDITLHNHAYGGLVVTVYLPVR